MIASAMEKAEVLVEALPYIKDFYGKKVVIKYGGAAMTDCNLKQKVMQDIVLMHYVGMHPIVVHGGGPEINHLLNRLHIPSEFVDGLRVTDADTMEVVEMVLGGKVNKEIVAGLNASGGRAVGLSGKDGNLIEAGPMDYSGKNGVCGRSATHKSANHRNSNRKWLHTSYRSIGIDAQQQTYNINADLVAAAVAVHMQADKLVLLTDVPGLLQDPADSSSLISILKVSDVERLVAEGVIAGGMTPKVRCCVEAVTGGVGRTHIIDGRVPHSILLEVFTREGIGTMVVNG